MAALSESAGWPLMPWQRLVADVGGEMARDETSGLMVPAYREVIVTVMRQSGKTTLVLAVQCDRCLMWGRPQRVAYTAQTGLDGRQKFAQDQIPMLRLSPLDAVVDRYYVAADNTGIVWSNGSRISVLSTGKESGHGKTLDLAVIDEAFADEDDRREQALLPAMTTRPAAQMWNTSTAGTPASTYLLRKVELGRAAAEAGKTSGVAYFEWSIPDAEDIDDPEIWWQYMPALGYTMTEATISHARQTMTEGDFRRAFGNQWVATDERSIPALEWERIVGPAVTPGGGLVFGVDAPPDQASASIVACDLAGRLELVENRPGVAWLPERVEQLAKAHAATVVVGAGTVIAYMVDGWKLAGVNADIMPVAEVVQSSARFLAAIVEGTVSVRRDPRLDQAAAAVNKRKVGDAWTWSRVSVGNDISPIVAATLAHGRAVTGMGLQIF